MCRCDKEHRRIMGGESSGVALCFAGVVRCVAHKISQDSWQGVWYHDEGVSSGIMLFVIWELHSVIHRNKSRACLLIPVISVRGDDARTGCEASWAYRLPGPTCASNLVVVQQTKTISNHSMELAFNAVSLRCHRQLIAQIRLLRSPTTSA